LIPGLGRSPGEGMVTHFSVLGWRVPWTEEPGGTTEQLILLYLHTHIYICHLFFIYSPVDGHLG